MPCFSPSPRQSSSFMEILISHFWLQLPNNLSAQVVRWASSIMPNLKEVMISPYPMTYSKNFKPSFKFGLINIWSTMGKENTQSVGPHPSEPGYSSQFSEFALITHLLNFLKCTYLLTCSIQAFCVPFFLWDNIEPMFHKWPDLVQIVVSGYV